MSNLTFNSNLILVLKFLRIQEECRLADEDQLPLTETLTFIAAEDEEE